jgi:probable rRNA maturation factor
VAIRFHSQGVKFDLQNKNLHKSWIKSNIIAHKRITGSLNFIYISNPGLREMNMEYLNHDYYTDVITFDYTEGDIISGDIFISIDQVRLNAGAYGKSFEDELRRVMVHGVLHLIGFGDANVPEKEMMLKMENEALHLWLKEE